MATRSESAWEWSAASQRSLIRYIVFTDHEYLRRELPAIEARVAKVYRLYKQRYGPTLIGLPEVFAGLKVEFESHLTTEEGFLFPVIEAYEAVAHPVTRLPRMLSAQSRTRYRMGHENYSAAEALARIREITGSYHVPEPACELEKFAPLYVSEMAAEKAIEKVGKL